MSTSWESPFQYSFSQSNNMSWNGTQFNSTHTFKYHKQQMNLLVSTKYNWIGSKTMCFGKKRVLLAKETSFEKINFHLQVPKVFLGKAKRLTFYIAFTPNFFTAHLFQPFQFCSLWCNFLNPCAVSNVTFSTLYF